MKTLTAVLGALLMTSLHAQPTYRCTENGKTSYSNVPCPGAQIVDTTPTQGLDKSSGSSRKGASVQRDEYRTLIGEGIFGETKQQYEARHRRSKLPASAQAECSRLDASIADDTDKEALYQRRKRYHDLKC